jgi:hypothetical protein
MSRLEDFDSNSLIMTAEEPAAILIESIRGMNWNP